jgi:hypothetical protein
MMVAFYNKTMDALTFPTITRISNLEIQNSSSYKAQKYQMLPIEQNHLYSIQ